VADFAAATLAALAAHYDVTVVADEAPSEVGSLSRTAFRDQWWQFDRVLYHLGNSVHHSRDLDLLAEVPGCVVLHDAVLSGALHGSGTGLGHPDGVAGLMADDGPAPPPSDPDLRGLRAVLAPALGLVLHSAHALQLLREGGVTTAATTVTRLAVPRSRPQRQVVPAEPGKRLLLGHFGFVNPFKGADLLIEAAGRLVARGRPCEVVFVGDFVAEALRAAVQRRAAALGVRMTITGFIDDDDWQQWLDTVDCAVQLRTQSHGESSAALGELLAAGIPVVCTDGGSFAEIPDGVVRRVPLAVDAGCLADTLVDVLDTGAAAGMAEAAVGYIRDECSPEVWAIAVRDLVERSYTHNLARSWAVASEALDPGSPGPELFEVRGGGERRFHPWISDVSVYAGTPFFSGIQRVTTRLHSELAGLLEPRSGSLHPVRLTEGLPGPSHPELTRDPLTWRPSVPLREAEWLLCIDLNVRLARHREELLAARASGLRVAVVVHDIIPVLNPEWFPRESGDVGFAAWLSCVLDVADVLVVNSKATADQTMAFVDQHRPRRSDSLHLAALPWGWDLGSPPPPASTQPRDVDHLLMVGTVEPRKGHAEVLDAFEALWAEGSGMRLTVVGRRGWLVDDVVRRMERLDRTGGPFRWVEGGTDAELESLYARCTAVLMASYAEGFGLPVVEAALRGCHAVVRDIPVLREVAGSNATYIAADGSDLRAVIKQLSARARAGRLPVKSTAHVRSWADVARELAEVLRDERPADATWDPRTASWRVG
jgi:glycosyltransferase involved in cell wall biosynthesis